jgi:hypothetical protein
VTKLNSAERSKEVQDGHRYGQHSGEARDVRGIAPRQPRAHVALPDRGRLRAARRSFRCRKRAAAGVRRTDRATLLAHFAEPNARAFIAQARKLAAEPPSISIYTADEISFSEFLGQ